MKKMLPLFKNFYFLAVLSFVFLMVFLDTPGLLMQWQIARKLNDLQERKKQYTQKLEKIKEEHKLMRDNSAHIEKVAREKYFMKRPNEDIYVVRRTP